MSLFPSRSSLSDFLQRYEQLPSDDDEEFDLGEESSSSDDDDDVGEEEMAGFVQPSEGTAAAEDWAEDEEAKHKEFDAALRATERKQLEALAKSFEAKAAEYAQPDLEYTGRYNAELRAAAQAAKLKREQEAEAALMAETAAAAAAAKEKAALLAKRKAALDSLYEEDAEQAPTTVASICRPTCPTPLAKQTQDKRTASSEKGAVPASGTRYRIKKRVRVA